MGVRVHERVVLTDEGDGQTIVVERRDEGYDPPLEVRMGAAVVYASYADLRVFAQTLLDTFGEPPVEVEVES